MDSEKKVKIGITIAVILAILYVIHLDSKNFSRVVDERDNAKYYVEELQHIISNIQNRAERALGEDEDDPDYDAYLYVALEDIHSMCYQAEQYPAEY